MLKSRVVINGAKIVATVHSPASLAAARRLRAEDGVDFLELRVDAFAQNPDLLLRATLELSLPLIVTVRDPHEGGATRDLTAKKRRELFEKFLPHAALVDVELRAVLKKELAPVLDAARANGVQLILSHHDFKKTPPLVRLTDLTRQAWNAGADIFKVATMAANPRHLATLLDFLTRRESKQRPALAVMAMGRFGKISRLLFAQCGSVLNYGFLDAANASGQWPARLLKKRIEELGGENQTAKDKRQK